MGKKLEVIIFLGGGVGCEGGMGGYLPSSTVNFDHCHIGLILV